MNNRMYKTITIFICVCSFTMNTAQGNPVSPDRHTLAPQSSFGSQQEETQKKFQYELFDQFLQDKKTKEYIFSRKEFPPLPPGITPGFVTIQRLKPISNDIIMIEGVINGSRTILYFFRQPSAVSALRGMGLVKEHDLALAAATGYWITTATPSKRPAQVPEEPAIRMIDAPLSRIPAEDVKNILVFGLVDKIRIGPKLGEEIIMLWPLVTALHHKYPHTNIYVATQFPDVFFAHQFNDKVIPIPRNEHDVVQWQYNRSRWKDMTVAGISNYKDRNSLINFVAANKIDMVFSLASHRQSILIPDELTKRNITPPHQFTLDALTTYSSAMGPTLWSIPKEPVYQDRTGTVYTVTGMDEVRKEITPSTRLIPAGIWKWMILTFNKLGLEIDQQSLTTLRLDIGEAVGALAFLRELFYKNNPHGVFDPTKKLILVNVYAVTQGSLITEDEWVSLITTLINNVGNAYFLFTHGGEMDADYMLIENIIAEVRKRVPDTENTMLLPKVNIYPYINDLLGITSGIITPDTGMSHLASGVYNIPTAVITTDSILHWMPPRDNALPAIVMSTSELILRYQYSPYSNNAITLQKRNFAFMLEKIRDFAEGIARQPERPEAVAAKVAAATYAERVKLDQDLLDKTVSLPYAEEDLRGFIRQSLDAVALDETIPTDGLIPKIAFVDSSSQTGVGVKRFGAKLYSPIKEEPVLLVDISLLEKTSLPDGTIDLRVTDSAKQFDVLHEIIGHLLIWRLFPGYLMLQDLSNITDTPVLREYRAEEEVLARITHFLAIYKLYKTYGTVPDKSTEKKFQRMEGISGIDEMVDLTIRYISILDRNECLSTYGYAKTLRDRLIAQRIKDRIIQKYLPQILNALRLQGTSGIPDSLRRSIAPDPANAVVETNA